MKLCEFSVKIEMKSRIRNILCLVFNTSLLHVLIANFALLGDARCIGKFGSAKSVAVKFTTIGRWMFSCYN